MMKALISKNLAKAYDGPLKDAVHQFVGVKSSSGGDIDPITGVYTTESVKSYTGRGTLDEYTIEEKQVMQFDITDLKLSALQTETTGSPSIGDSITIKGQEVRVVHVGTDSIDAMWILQLRGFSNGLE